MGIFATLMTYFGMTILLSPIVVVQYLTENSDAFFFLGIDFAHAILLFSHKQFSVLSLSQPQRISSFFSFDSLRKTISPINPGVEFRGRGV